MLRCTKNSPYPQCTTKSLFTWISATHARNLGEQPRYKPAYSLYLSGLKQVKPARSMHYGNKQLNELTIFLTIPDGSLKTVKELNFRVTDVKSSSMTVEWDSVPEAHSYIVYIYNKAQPSEERTMALNAALNEYKITDLEPGSLYEIGSKCCPFLGLFCAADTRRKVKLCHFSKKRINILENRAKFSFHFSRFC